MGIREEREGQAAQFVSMRDLMEGLAAIEATTIKEVAGYLLHKLNTDGSPRFIRQDAQSLGCFKADTKQSEKLLRYIGHWGDYPGDSEFDNPSREEFDSYGWLREEITEFLKGLGVKVPPCCFPLWKPEPKRPYWFKAYENRIRITVDEAVWLLNGIDPENSEPFHTNDDAGWSDIQRWRNSLRDAVDSELWDFEPSTWGIDRGDQKLLHSAIKAWARATSAPWPFLDDTKAPAPESPEGRAMARELKAAKDRVAELEQEVQEKRQTGSDTPQPTKLMTLAVEVQKQFWMTFDEDAPGARPPSQNEIILWLETDCCLSNANAKAVEKVACPFDRNPANKK